jgi:membrane associated rhomboid family serine protease
MFPISDDNPTLRTPVVTMLLLLVLALVWLFFQGAAFFFLPDMRGMYELRLLASVCDYGFIPGELTGLAPVGMRIPVGDVLGRPMPCFIDRAPINLLTPLTSMFLHGGWMHLIGNGLYLWVFGNNVEDSLGRGRFVIFYLACGLAAAAAQLMVDPSAAMPMVGASGAISGVMGGYLILYPRVRVNVLFILFIFIRIFPVPAWAVLLWWIATQVLSGLPQLAQIETGHTGGVAFWAHIGGFVAGVVLVKLMENPALVRQRTALRHRVHPDHP